MCLWVEHAGCALHVLLFLFLISRFVVWHVEVVRAHLQICLLHKSLPFFMVDGEGKLAGSEKVLFKHPQLLSCPTLGILLIHK